ncbi:Nickel-dependent hydrogenase b-type cytochrome subunit [Roseobacter sp. SK209-2-6]|nr:Nickel-dependent hydrogenase b-type cytochrome subunit [Roseobacter sp. SK209-2-6]
MSAILIFALLGSGFRAASLDESAAKEAILMIHAPLGGAIVLLTLLRLFWWWRVDQKPEPGTADPAWQIFVAKAVHVLFYFAILGMGASGIGLFALSGAGDVVFGAGSGPLPDFADYAPRMPHGLGARLMMALLALHAGAALYHHFIKKDGLLWRMWFGSKG